MFVPYPGLEISGLSSFNVVNKKRNSPKLFFGMNDGKTDDIRVVNRLL